VAVEEEGASAVPPPDTTDPVEHDAAPRPVRGTSVSVTHASSRTAVDDDVPGSVSVSIADASSPAAGGPVDHAADDAADSSVSVADTTSHGVSGPVDDAADKAAVDDGAVDRAPDEAEDQPGSAPATNGHTDAADPDPASTNGSGHHPDPAVAAARGEADPR
jgi:hypothetical protein